MFILSGFGDEIASDLDEQLDVLCSLGIHHLELRGAWGKNVLDFDGAEVKRIGKALAARGMAVSAIGSPIGKVALSAPSAPHLDDLRRILDTAAALDSPYVRLFSFWVAPGEHDDARPEVMRRLEAFVRAAEPYPTTLLHENEKDIYGDTPEHCADIFETLRAANLKACYDPANFVQVGVERPFERGWLLLGDYVVYAHIKDAHLATGEVVPAGEGAGQLPELLGALSRRGGSYFLSLEPHLVLAGQSVGFTGRHLFERATAALRQLLVTIGEPQPS